MGLVILHQKIVSLITSGLSKNIRIFLFTCLQCYWICGNNYLIEYILIFLILGGLK